MKFFFTFLLLVATSIPLASFGQSSYSIQNIPDSLKENANVVYFLDEATFEIISDNKAVYKSHTVAAILNSKGKTHAAQYVGYDKLRKINSFSGKVYDQNGKEIKKLKKSEIVDQSNVSGFSLYEDNRVQYADLKQNSYPYIVEFEYEAESKYTYTIPSWSVLSGEGVSVIKSSYKITAPKEFKPNTKLINTDRELQVTEADGKIEILFETENVKAIERESIGPPMNELTPILYATSSKFNYEGYEGSFNSWDEMGKWQNQLNKGRNILPESTINEIRKIANAFESREDKIRAVYQYVQEKTRYISIQLGIGGFQPFPASSVDELGYGDCKALSNYTYSLLENIGIESNYTWVYGGQNPPKIDKDFPADRFNHIILCVPNKQDTIWLECTSQTNPFGYLGTFTGDRDVMVVTKDGGKIVHTPKYDKRLNTQNTFAEVSVTDLGKATADIKTVYSGLQYENNKLHWYVDYSNEEQKKWIYKNTNIADFSVVDFSFISQKDKIPSVVQKMKVNIPRLAKPNGSRVFLELNLLNKSSYIPERYEDRKTDLILSFQGIDTDTVVYNIPEHLYPEYIPNVVELESEFGKYYSSTMYENGKLTYIRKREYNKGRFSKEKYDAYRKFCKQVVKSDKAKAVFLNKT